MSETIIMHTPLGELPQRANEISGDAAIITVCGSGYHSSISTSLLQAQGFSNVSSMEGGMTAWNTQKLPIAKPWKLQKQNFSTTWWQRLRESRLQLITESRCQT